MRCYRLSVPIPIIPLCVCSMISIVVCTPWFICYALCTVAGTVAAHCMWSIMGIVVCRLRFMLCALCTSLHCVRDCCCPGLCFVTLYVYASRVQVQLRSTANFALTLMPRALPALAAFAGCLLQKPYPAKSTSLNHVLETRENVRGFNVKVAISSMHYLIVVKYVKKDTNNIPIR
jgi:hypothetical protein